MERLDVRGSQQLPLIDQRLKTIDDIVKHNTGRIDFLIQQQHNNPIVQSQFDAIKLNMLRVEGAQRRTSIRSTASTRHCETWRLTS